MSASASEDRIVTLKGGLVVPLEALQLALSLEARGAVLAVQGKELLIDTPRGLLMETDRAAIRRWKPHLMAIVAYESPDAQRQP